MRWRRPPLQVFLNGLWLGIHRDPKTLIEAMKGMRRQVDIDTDVRLCPAPPLPPDILWVPAGVDL